jgi:hypothetical protein
LQFEKHWYLVPTSVFMHVAKTLPQSNVVAQLDEQNAFPAHE